MGMKYTDDVKCVVELSKDGSGNWYWAVKINGEVYADGEEGTKDAARLRCSASLGEWKDAPLV